MPPRRTATALVHPSSGRPSTGCLIILISKGVAAAMPGRALVLREKECGEGAQAQERSGLNGSKGKTQVGGDLGVGVPAEVGQHQDLALLHGQADEGAANFMG